MLLAQAEVNWLLANSNDHCYPMFCTLLRACRTVADSEGASQVQAAMERLIMITLAPVATVLERGLALRNESGVSCDGFADMWQRWLELRQHVAYTPQLHMLHLYETAVE